MKKRYIVVLMLLVLLLCGCTEQPGTTEGLTTVPDTTAPEVPSGPKWTGYTGTLKDYVYYYEEDRDRLMEEDVLHIAEVFVGNVYANGHPMLTDMEFLTFFPMDGQTPERISHYDPLQRQMFISRVSELIPQIGKMEDYQVLYQLQMAVAALGDLHSSVGLLQEHSYPLVITPLYKDGQLGYYATVIPSTYTYTGALFSKLVAINGYEVDQVVSRLKMGISYEAEAGAMRYIAAQLVSNEVLSCVAITEYKKDAIFTFECADGKTVDLTLSALTDEQLKKTSFVGQSDNSFLYFVNHGPNYWWEYQDDKGVLYARYNRIEYMSDLTFTEFTKQITDFLKVHPEVQKLVVDLRNNPGGYFDSILAINLASVFNRLDGQKGYVLVNGGTYSAAISLSSNLMQLTENVTFVGSPGGQPVNFYASVHDYTTPNLQFSFRMSDTWWVNDRQDTDPALMPDVVIHQTLEDFCLGVDTVMAYIYGQ